LYISLVFNLATSLASSVSYTKPNKNQSVNLHIY
jgi:hypothetical protein